MQLEGSSGPGFSCRRQALTRPGQARAPASHSFPEPPVVGLPLSQEEDSFRWPPDPAQDVGAVPASSLVSQDVHEKGTCPAGAIPTGALDR